MGEETVKSEAREGGLCSRGSCLSSVQARLPGYVDGDSQEDGALWFTFIFDLHIFWHWCCVLGVRGGLSQVVFLFTQSFPPFPLSVLGISVSLCLSVSLPVSPFVLSSLFLFLDSSPYLSQPSKCDSGLRSSSLGIHHRVFGHLSSIRGLDRLCSFCWNLISASNVYCFLFTVTSSTFQWYFKPCLLSPGTSTTCPFLLS